MFERDTVELAVDGVLQHDPWVYREKIIRSEDRSCQGNGSTSLFRLQPTVYYTEILALTASVG
jgi:hypothetical protein